MANGTSRADIKDRKASTAVVGPEMGVSAVFLYPGSRRTPFSPAQVPECKISEKFFAGKFHQPSGGTTQQQLSYTHRVEEELMNALRVDRIFVPALDIVSACKHYIVMCVAELMCLRRR